MRLTLGFEGVVVTRLVILAMRLPGARGLAHGWVVVDVAVNLEVNFVLLALLLLSSHVQHSQNTKGTADEHSTKKDHISLG